MPPLDPRIHAFRHDLADVSLQGTVEAMHFVEPVIRQCVRGVVPLLAEANPDAMQVSQIRYGEFLDVFETRGDGFAWVQSRTDRTVGYMPANDTMNDAISDLSYRISALRTFVYPEPDPRTPPFDELTLGAYIQPGERKNGFAALVNGGYVFAGHIIPATDALTPDYVFTAGQLLGAPYLWGGRTPKGVDGAGLVQLVLEMAGIEAPRDSILQSETFGRALDRHWRDTAWKRGDLVFFSEHVGIMTSPDYMIHANAHAMSVTVEPLLDAVMRGLEIRASGRPESASGY